MLGLNRRRWLLAAGCCRRSLFVCVVRSDGDRLSESSTSWPKARQYAAMTVDGAGNIWMMGGGDIDLTVNFNDLWRYRPSTSKWWGSRCSLAVHSCLLVSTR